VISSLGFVGVRTPYLNPSLFELSFLAALGKPLMIIQGCLLDENIGIGLTGSGAKL